MSLRNMRVGLRASLLVIEDAWMPSIENIHDSATNISTIRQ